MKSSKDIRKKVSETRKNDEKEINVMYIFDCTKLLFVVRGQTLYEILYEMTQQFLPFTDSFGDSASKNPRMITGSSLNTSKRSR